MTPAEAHAWRALQPCELQRAARRFGYELTSSHLPGRGEVWFASPAVGVRLTIGVLAEVHRFLENHARWQARGLEGLERIKRWRSQKLRSAKRGRVPPSLVLPEARRG